MESAAYCYQILLVPFYTNSTQNMSINWIIWLLLSLFVLAQSDTIKRRTLYQASSDTQS